MLEAALQRLSMGPSSVSHGAALHENDRMVAVFASHRCGKSEHISRLRAARDEFEARCGNVMAFVDDQMTVPANLVGDDAFSD